MEEEERDDLEEGEEGGVDVRSARIKRVEGGREEGARYAPGEGSSLGPRSGQGRTRQSDTGGGGPSARPLPLQIPIRQGRRVNRGQRHG